jgi:serine/threonine protein kinase
MDLITNNYYRWHQDVKPRNILVVSNRSSNPYDVSFKLADLGLSHFKRTVEGGVIATDDDVSGTQTYGKNLTRELRPTLTSLQQHLNASDRTTFGTDPPYV